jgi:hypothetical protein
MATLIILAGLYKKYGPGLIEGCENGDRSSQAIVGLVGIVRATQP